MRLSRYGEGEPSRPDAATGDGEGTAGPAGGPAGKKETSVASQEALSP